MDIGTLLFTILVFFVVPVIVVCLFVYASRFKRVPPDQAMVIFGKRHAHGVDVVKGGGRFIWPVIEEVDYIPLSVRTLDIAVESVVTQEGVMLDVDAVAQVKIASEESLLKVAAEQLLNKGKDEINYVAQRSLEGHVRGVCARLTVEEINSDRNKVAEEVQDSAGNDLARMGLEVVSFTIRDLRDQVGYLEALGKRRTAEIKRDAIIGEADAKRDSDIQSAGARKDGRTAEAIAETQIAEAIRDKNLKIAAYEEQVKKKEADRDISYSIQKSLREQELVDAQMGIKIREKQKAIELEQQEIDRRERELEATIRRPAKAEADKAMMIAEGRAQAAVKEGKASADVVDMKGKADADVRFYHGKANADVAKAQGNAEAEVISSKGLAAAEALQARGLAEGKAIEAKGLAEATAMDKKAEAWRKYGEAALASMVIDKLPEVADKLAPLENTEKIIIMGGDRGPSALVGDSVRSMVELTTMMKGLTGIDLQEMIKGFAPGDKDDEVKDAKILKK